MADVRLATFHLFERRPGGGAFARDKRPLRVDLDKPLTGIALIMQSIFV